MDRRSFGALMVATLAGVTVIQPASAKNPARDLETRLQQFKAFPGTTSFRIDIGRNEVASDSAAAQLFVASAIKTFIVCQYLRDVEAGRLSEDEQLPVNDSVRNSDSAVLLDLTGTTPAPLDLGGDDHPQRQHGNRHRPATCWSKSGAVLHRRGETACNAYS